MRILMAIFILISAIAVNATILTVSQNGTAEYTVIQQAINASANSDTVLVMPGRYIENISLNGKNITIASNEINTGNPEYIHSTIIDGSHSGSTVKIKNGETNVKVQGLTITNGSGDYAFFDQYCGGGIIITAPASGKTVTIVNCQIISNSAGDGAGIFSAACNLILEGTSIHNNTASDSGGGLYYGNSGANTYSLTFNAESRCSVYNNYAPTGTDMFFFYSNNQSVILDTCTVLNPWNYYICARPSNENIVNPFSFDIQHFVHQEVNHDLYVSPWGDDDNSGLNASEPMKTIALAVYKIAADSLNPKTIYLARGIYSPSLNGQMLPIPVKRHLSLVGESEEATIIDADNLYGAINSINNNQNIVIRQVTLRNCKYGIFAWTNARLRVENVSIEDMQDISYGALFIAGCFRTEFNNVIIKNVTSSNANGGLYTYHTTEILLY